MVAEGEVVLFSHGVAVNQSGYVDENENRDVDSVAMCMLLYLKMASRLTLPQNTNYK